MIYLIALMVMIIVPVFARGYVHMAQLTGYKPNEYAAWLKKNLIRMLPPALIIAVPLAAGFLLAFPWAEGVMLIYALAMELVIWLIGKKHPAKKPLAYTGRVKRLFAVASAVSAALFLLLSFFMRGFIALYIVFAIQGALMALCVLIAKPLENAINRYYIQDAKRKLAGMDGLIKIGITGSYGKTSTKMFLGTLLSEKYKTLVSPQSYNTTLGITRTIRENLTPEHEVFVAEMGARYKGDIAELCELVSPKYGIITSIGPQHLETFITQQNVSDTKFELIEALPQDGYALFPADSGLAEELFERARVNKGLFGIDSDREPPLSMQAKDIKIGTDGSSFTLVNREGVSIAVTTRLLGRHNIENIVGCCAMAWHLGLSMQQIAAGIAKLKPVEHRLELLPTANGVTVIDDAFNSNPAGARSALDVLAAFNLKRIIITPGMVELGAREAEENEKLGEYMAGRVDVVILIGKKRSLPLLRGLERALFNMENAHVAKDLNEASQMLASVGGAGSVVLFENDLPDNYNE